jgi:hypothetical protein
MQKLKSRISWNEESCKIYVRIICPRCEGVSKSRPRSYYPQFLLAFKIMFIVILIQWCFETLFETSVKSRNLVTSWSRILEKLIIT